MTPGQGGAAEGDRDGIRHRLFLAIPCPVRLDDEAGRLAGVADWARPVPQEYRHITLIFLGNQSSEVMQALACKLADPGSLCGLAAFSYGLTSAEALPRPPAARTLLLMSQGREFAACLDRVQRLTADAIAGFVPESRPFRPHVTLARFRGGRSRKGASENPDRSQAPMAAVYRALQLLDAALPVVMTADRIVLYRSELHPQGSRYEELAACPLLPLD